MKLLVGGSGSFGNSYILTDGKEYLILDAGVSLKAMMPLIDFQISKVSGVLVSHVHMDHHQFSKGWEQRGIPVITPFDDSKKIPQLRKSSCFKVQYFPLQDTLGEWVHTNGDGSKCPVYGFYITHPDLGTMVYCTDCEIIKWKFSNVNHFLLGTNYDLDIIAEMEENDLKSNHVYSGHLSIQAACKFVQANQNAELRNVILCHLSSQNGSPDDFKKKMQEVVGENTKVTIAKKGLEIDL